MGGWFSICSGNSSCGERSVTSYFRNGFKRVKAMRESLLEQVINLHQLPSVPNRIFSNGKSENSCIFTQQGQKGINQDAMVVWEVSQSVTSWDFISEDTVLCGVFDGHGPQGHLVSRKVRDSLPLKLMSFVKSPKARENGVTGGCFKKVPEGDGESLKDKPSENPLISLWGDAFLKSYKSMDKELRYHPSLDCFCSGSTSVVLVKQGQNLFIGNIGDSRAVLGLRDVNGSMFAVQLTVDLKPDLPGEAERIKRCDGRVFAMQDEPEVHRVWLPFEDAPGLAMSRAFGDFCLKDYGVISVPEFSHRILTEMDQFIVLASDGVWDVLSNEEVVGIVSSATSRSSAAHAVVDSADREWKLKYPTSRMDDCAVVCLYLDGKVDPESEPVEPIIPETINHSSHSGVNEPTDVQNLEPCLRRNFTVMSEEDNEQNGKTCVAAEVEGAFVTTEDQNWSGLEGVTRVNSLVQLPRFSQEKVNA